MSDTALSAINLFDALYTAAHSVACVPIGFRRN